MMCGKFHLDNFKTVEDAKLWKMLEAQTVASRRKTFICTVHTVLT